MKRFDRFLFKLIIKPYLKATELLYHQFAWAYDFVAWVVSFGYWSRWRLDALNYLKAGSILEIGFGTGSLLIAMKAHGYNVIGLERSPDMQQVTNRKLRRKGLCIKRVSAAAQAIPFLDGCFTNVLSTFPAKYILSEGTLREIRRVLENKGRLVVTGISVSFKRGLKRWFTRFFLEDAGNVFTRHLAEKAEGLGFQSSMIKYETKTYILPVLILEKMDD